MALMVRIGQGKGGTGAYSLASTGGISEEFSGMTENRGFKSPEFRVTGCMSHMTWVLN